MHELPSITPFVEVAERSSFRRAAEALGVSPAAVSKAVARLEDSVGVRLLDRTTRRVALTPEGARFLLHCRASLDALQAGRDALAEAHRVPSGTLRVSTSIVLGPLVGRLLPRLADRHPRLVVHVAFSDQQVDLIAEEIDVAIRVGVLPDSSLRARRLGGCRRITVGSPSYLARAGTPQRVDDLLEHRCLAFVGPSGRSNPWSFRDGRRLDVSGPLQMNDGAQLVAAAVAGMGLLQPLDFMVRDELADGRLVQVLHEHTAEGPPIHAVWLEGRERLPAVRVFLDALHETASRP